MSDAATCDAARELERLKRAIFGLRDDFARQRVELDLMRRDRLLALSQDLFGTGVYSDVFMISADKGYGVADLKAVLAERMPKGPYFFPEDQAADVPQRVMAAEITREKLYLRLHKELPYASHVETEGWQEKRDGSVRIDQIIYIERDTQKPIVLGKGGQTIKKIGELARADMEDLFGCKVHLFLQVQVKPNWADRSEHYTSIGLDFNS